MGYLWCLEGHFSSKPVQPNTYRVWRKSSGWRMGDETVLCSVEESDECLLLKLNWGVSQWGWDAAAKTGGRSPIPACLAGSLALRTSPTCGQ